MAIRDQTGCFFLFHARAQLCRDVLLRDGTAVDAAIATMFCDAVFNPQSTGIGGGFFMTIYTKSTGEVVHLNARETAPSYSFPDMYGDDSSGPKFGESPLSPQSATTLLMLGLALP